MNKTVGLSYNCYSRACRKHRYKSQGFQIVFREQDEAGNKVFIGKKKDSLQRDRNSILGEINLIEPKQKPVLVWCGLEAAVAGSLYFFFFLI